MNEPYPPAFQRKFAVLGQRGVGKSSLTHYFATGRFINRYDPTIENTLRQTIVRDSGDRYHCEIVDTAGMDESTSSLSRNATVGVHGYLLVFSLASRHSLEQLRAINDVLYHMMGDPPSIPTVLVGTMKDLKQQRVVTYEQAQQIAEEFRIPYVECSSKTGESVDFCFRTLLNEVEKENDRVSIAEIKKTEEFSLCLLS